MNTFFIIIMSGVFILGLVTGVVSNVTSGGAGVFTIFVLAEYGGLSIQKAVGTVLAASTVFVLVGAITFYQKREVDSQLSITLGLTGVAGAFFAARLASSLQSTAVEHAFGILTLAVAGYSLFRLGRLRTRTRVSVFEGPISEVDGSPTELSRWRGRDPVALIAQVGIGTLIGLATGLFGVGGGGLTMAVLLFAFNLRAKLMLGTSLMASSFRYAGGSLGYLSTGLIDPTMFLILAVGGGIGSLLGARVVITRTKDAYVQVIVVLLLLFVSLEFLRK